MRAQSHLKFSKSIRYYIKIFTITFFILSFPNITSNKAISKKSGLYSIESNENCLKTQSSEFNAIVYIDADKIIRELPSDLFGSNVEYGDFGNGILDPNTNQINEGVVQKFKDSGISTIRFPGGCHSDLYHWRDGVGPVEDRPLGINYFTGEEETNEYGTDEHCAFCILINAEPTITANFGNGTPQEAANWVEYCNGVIPDIIPPGWDVDTFKGNETADDGYFAWLRGQFGHPEPYNVKKWEVGNEVYNSWTENYNSTEYANRFIEFYDAMKSKDQTIKIAAVGYDDADGIYNRYGRDTAQWNREVARIVGSKMDAIHIHTYQPVSDDGHSVIFLYNQNRTAPFEIQEAGEYQLKLLAEGRNAIGDYPPSDGIFSNLNIYIDDIFQNNIELDTPTTESPLTKYYFLNFTLSAGKHNLTIAFTNDYYNPSIGDGRDAMFRADVKLNKGDTEILVQFRNNTSIYDAIMAGPLQIKEEIVELKKILNEEIGPNNIEIWLTEFNIWYGLLGFRLEQTLEFKSALAAADIAVQGVHGGLDMMQQWSLINNWYFGFITDELILGERSIFKIYSLMIEGLGTQLINSTVNCPKFNLTEKFGNIQPRINVPYLDVMPTMDNNHLYIIMINKHPTKYLDVSTVINGLSLDNIITQKIINSSAPDIIDQNPPESMYKYDSGKVGQAIMLNESHSIFHGAHNNFFDDEGTLEFWFKPNWDGDDGKPHRIMSIGYNFGISKSSDNLLYAYFLTHEDTPEIIPLIIATPVSSWKAGVWQHIAITWNQENDFIMYINGTERYSEPFMDKRIYINPQHEVIIGSSIQYKVNGSDGYFDEFRTLNVSRNSSGILSDYILGNEGSALLVDDNTTILYHFEKSLLDSQRDERTHLTVKTFSCSSNNIPLKLPPCSISLIKISLYKDGDNSDGSDSKNGASSKSKREGNFSLILVGSLALGAGGVILTIFIVLVKHNKKKRI